MQEELEGLARWDPITSQTSKTREPDDTLPKGLQDKRGCYKMDSQSGIQTWVGFG